MSRSRTIELLRARFAKLEPNNRLLKQPRFESWHSKFQISFIERLFSHICELLSSRSFCGLISIAAIGHSWSIFVLSRPWSLTKACFRKRFFERDWDEQDGRRLRQCSGRRRPSTQDPEGGQGQEQGPGSAPDHGRAASARSQGEAARDRSTASETEDPGCRRVGRLSGSQLPPYL